MAPTTSASFVGPPVPASIRVGNFAQQILTPANLQTVVAGAQIAGTLRQGREAERLGKERAAIDIANAEAVRRATVERVRITSERGQRFIEAQKAAAISGGIRTNVGVPLLIEAQTRSDIAQDIGFDLDVGRVEAGQFESSAQIERRLGRFKKRKSRFDAIGVGVSRGIAFL